MANNAKPTALGGGEPNRKVNLASIKSNIVRKGKVAYTNPALEADILALDPTVEGDAFYWSEAKVNLNASEKKVQADKMRYRTRVLSVAKRLNRPVSIFWTEEGEMVIALKVNETE